jgi:hypothetical protein
MWRVLKICLPAAGLGGLASVGMAFSLLGELEPWQVAEIGYGPDYSGDIGGPKHLGEEYRYAVPVVSYAFDASFLNYFGQEGVRQVEAAFAILNALPPVSTLSPDLSERQFQGEKRGVNHLAAALGLVDLKSYALGLVLETMGVGSSERYCFSLRAHANVNNVDYFSVGQFNFDPVTLRPSPFVNGTLYTYQIVQTRANPDQWEALEVQVDPTSAIFSAASSLVQSTIIIDAFGFAQSARFSGIYFRGLTRDDVGALRYMLHPLNFNVEALPPNSRLVGGGGFVGGGGGGGGGFWSDPLVGGGGPVDVPWGDPFGALNPALTNIATNIIVTNIVAGTLADPALHAGLDKLTFRRVNFDSLLGLATPFTNRWVDTYLTNSVFRRQTVESVSAAPHILFGAADLGVNNIAVPVLARRSAGWRNNAAINTARVIDDEFQLGGPGTIEPTVTISLSKLRPAWWHIGVGGPLSPTATPLPVWGSFDGSTNTPVVYPVGTSIRELEDLVLGRRR